MNAGKECRNVVVVRYVRVGGRIAAVGDERISQSLLMNGGNRLFMSAKKGQKKKRPSVENPRHMIVKEKQLFLEAGVNLSNLPSQRNII